MTTKEQIIQEIDHVSEPLLEEILQFIRSRKKAQVDPVEAYLDQLLTGGKYAEDVSLEELAAHDAAARDYLEGRDRGLSTEELIVHVERASGTSRISLERITKETL